MWRWWHQRWRCDLDLFVINHATYSPSSFWSPTCEMNICNLASSFRSSIMPHWKVKPWIDSEKISDLRTMCSERTLLSHCLYLDSPMWSVMPWMWSVMPSLSDVWLRRGVGGGPGMRWGWIEEGLPAFLGRGGGEGHQRGVWDDPERLLGTMVIVTRVSVSCEPFICSSVQRFICKFCPCDLKTWTGNNPEHVLLGFISDKSAVPIRSIEAYRGLRAAWCIY